MSRRLVSGGPEVQSAHSCTCGLFILSFSRFVLFAPASVWLSLHLPLAVVPPGYLLFWFVLSPSPLTVLHFLPLFCCLYLCTCPCHFLSRTRSYRQDADETAKFRFLSNSEALPKALSRVAENLQDIQLLRDMLEQILVLFARLAGRYQNFGLAVTRQHSHRFGCLLPALGILCSKLPSLNAGTPVSMRSLHPYMSEAF